MHKKLDNPRDATQYCIAGPVTFRRASRKLFGSRKDRPNNNFGSNRQNIEKSMRELWIADDGYSLVQVDQSGADALIVAHLTRAGKYRSLFQNGIKPHVYMALQLFPQQWKKKWRSADEIDIALRTPIPELPKLPFWKELVNMVKDSDNWQASERYYFLGKKVVHAFSYGMMGNRLQQSVLGETYGEVVIERKLADDLIAFAHAQFPEIRHWHSDIFRQAVSTKQLRNLFGHPLNITWRVDPNDMKDLYAWIPQNTVATITCNAICDTYEYIEKENKSWHLLQETHDSLLTECIKGEEVLCGKVVSGFINRELVAPDGTRFRMKSEAQAGENWAPYKKDYNERGLKELCLQ